MPLEWTSVIGDEVEPMVLAPAAVDVCPASHLLSTFLQSLGDAPADEVGASDARERQGTKT